ncbi:MAG: endonuclease MutS2 [Candidatus Riflebacteria bacterium]|nr:endonuclease MutS2 [Candidatus Riflebacteria bacterium]
MEEKSLLNLEFEKVLNIVAGYAGSYAAKESIQQIRPSSDKAVVEKMLSEMDELMLLHEEGRSIEVGGIRELRDLFSLSNPSSDVLSGEEFIRVRIDIEVSIEIKSKFPEYDSRRGVDRFGRLRKLIDEIPDLSSIAERILYSINEQGEVRDDASPALASIRRDLIKSRSEIERKLGDFLGTSNEAFQDRFFTLRNDRYVVPVKASFQNTFQGIVHDQSGSGQTVFIEPLEFLALNNKLVRLRSAEKEEIIRILRSLTEMVKNRISELRMMFETLVFFDCMNAKARFAREFHACKPEISKTGYLELFKARHPMIHPDCVPLDIKMNRENACIIITGPNGGGKTVAMKIVGINALLMQSGFWILATENSMLPIFDEVLADIGESQSIENHLSTFTSHLKRIKEILDAATSYSIVLVDEIGVGTDPNEGSALAEGVLKTLFNRGCLTIVTSHFDSLKSLAFTTTGFVNAGMEFDYQNYKPTFRFLLGVSGKSNALSVARTFGLPEEVISVMTSCLHGKEGPGKDLIDILERERMHAERLRQNWEERIKELEYKEKQIAESLKKIEVFRKSKRDELTEEFEAEMKSRIKELEGVIHDLKSRLSSSEGNVQENLLTARSALKNAQTSLDIIDRHNTLKVQEKSSKNYIEEGRIPAVGDEVLWKTISKSGILEEIDSKNSRGVIECNGLRFTAPLDELQIVESSKKMKSRVSVAITPTVTVSDRLDLRGMRVEESLQQVEDYLKLASAQKLGKVFIVHGKGTGTLQRVIQDYLKTTKFRKLWRPGRYGEGDLGVTVVVFDPAADNDYASDALEKLSNQRIKKGAKN